MDLKSSLPSDNKLNAWCTGTLRRLHSSGNRFSCTGLCISCLMENIRPQKPIRHDRKIVLFYPIGSEQVQLTTAGQIKDFPEIAVSGQQLGITYRQIQGEEFFVFQVIFQPGMLHCLTGFPGNDLERIFRQGPVIPYI